eukprot:scaffold21058_cov21-Tisochrysis_lutea.AAC.1
MVPEDSEELAKTNIWRQQSGKNSFVAKLKDSMAVGLIRFGALLGITNTAGALPGVLGVTAAGYLLDATSSWALALFYPAAACQLFGAIMYTIFASSERQPWS